MNDGVKGKGRYSKENTQPLYVVLEKKISDLHKKMNDDKFDFGKFADKKYKKIKDTNYEVWCWETGRTDIRTVTKNGDGDEEIETGIFLMPEMWGDNRTGIVAYSKDSDLLSCMSNFEEDTPYIIMPNGEKQEINSYGELIMLLKGLTTERKTSDPSVDFSQYFALIDMLVNVFGEKQFGDSEQLKREATRHLDVLNAQIKQVKTLREEFKGQHTGPTIEGYTHTDQATE